MNIIKKYFSTTIVIMIFLSACGNQDLDGQIGFELVLIDDNGLGKNQFRQEENVTFILRLINKSGDDFQITNDEICHLLNQEEFLLVYNIIHNTGTEEDDLIPMGKPYKFPVICNLLGGPGTIFTYAQGYHDLFKFSWISEDTSNVPLNPGYYKTSIEYELWKSKVPLNISTEFKVI